MTRWYPLFCCLFISSCTFGQTDFSGIRNTGLAGTISLAAPEDSSIRGMPRLHKTLVMVNLYPGFAVCRQQFVYLNEATVPLTASLQYPLGGSIGQLGIGQLEFSSPYALEILSNRSPINRPDTLNITTDPVAADFNFVPQHRITKAIRWQQVFAPGMPTVIQVQSIVRTSLSRFIRGRESRDGNAFALDLTGASTGNGTDGATEVLVNLQEGLNLTNIWGLQPKRGISGDLTHIQYRPAGTDSTIFLVWYQGAPPDYPFTKKIAPFHDTLYKIMDAFPVAEFNAPHFKPQARDNFSLSPSGLTFSGVLYFLLFTIPWLVLGGIIIFLVRGKKRAKQTAS